MVKNVVERVVDVVSGWCFCAVNFVVEKSAICSGFIFCPNVKMRWDFLLWFPFRFDPWIAGLDWRDEEARDSGWCAGGDGGWGLGLCRWQGVGAGIWSRSELVGRVGGKAADDVCGSAADEAGERSADFASGKWVMFSATDVDLEKNTKVNHLWVVPMAAAPAEVVGKADSSVAVRNDSKKGGSEVRLERAERQVTFWKEGETGGRFSPDGTQVAFIATDSATGLSQILSCGLGRDAGTLGTPKRLTNVSTEADGAVWSPNSKRILFVSRVYPECSNEASWMEEDLCNKKKDDAAAANPVKAQVFDT